MSRLGQLQDVDLKLLRCFCTIVEEGSFAAAQASLNLSQSSLSEYLKALEVRLGLKLCQRGPKGFRLFEEGREVYLAARELFASIEAFKQSIANANNGQLGELTIAVQDAIIDNPASLIANAIERFTADHPEVRLRLEIMLGFQVIGRMADGLAAVGIGVENQRFTNLTFHRLFSEEISLYCGRSHALFAVPEKQISPEMIQSARYCSRGHQEKAHPERVGQVPMAGDVGLGAHAQLALVLSGRNVGYLPDHVALPNVEKNLLRRIRPDLTKRVSGVGVFSGPSTAGSMLARSFVKVLKRMYSAGRSGSVVPLPRSLQYR